MYVAWLSPSGSGDFTGVSRDAEIYPGFPPPQDILAFLHLRQPSSLLHLGKGGFRKYGVTVVRLGSMDKRGEYINDGIKLNI